MFSSSWMLARFLATLYNILYKTTANIARNTTAQTTPTIIIVLSVSSIVISTPESSDAAPFALPPDLPPRPPWTTVAAITSRNYAMRIKYVNISASPSDHLLIFIYLCINLSSNTYLTMLSDFTYLDDRAYSRTILLNSSNQFKE